MLATVGVWGEAAADPRRGHHRQHHGHHGFRSHGRHFYGPGFIGPRFYFGSRGYYGYPYYYPYYGYYYGYAAPPVVVTPPPAYVERPSPPAQYWHYCRNPPGYYPDVQQCPDGWIQVPPRTE